jgi:putative transposase
MPQYIRAFVPGGTFFFTVTLLERRRKLLTETLTTFGRCSRRPADAGHLPSRPSLSCPITCIASRLCLPGMRISPPAGMISKRDLPPKNSRGERLSARRLQKGERGIWPRRFWEHVIRDERDYERHVDYIHYNPVKYGQVTKVAAWPYSSFHRYVERGIYNLEWAADDNVRSLEME